jgi:hypothetical protein
MVETHRIKITQDAIAVLLTSDGTEVRFKDEPIEALKDILGLVDFAPNSMVSQRLLECKGQSFDLPDSYTAQVVETPCCKLNPLGCDDCTNYQKYAKLCIRN